jgi:hypothetical protein
MVKKIMLWVVIKSIRKWFPDGVMLITDYEGNPIAHQWTWSNEINKLVK